MIRNFLVILAIGLMLAACGQGQPEGGLQSSEQQVAATKAAPAVAAPKYEKVAVKDPENAIYLDTKHGRVVIEMRPDLAPNHVKRVKLLTRKGFYNGLKFHRVIAGFMAQTGDPKGDGTGGSELPDLKAEFSDAEFSRGALGMARSSSHDSANSQFFICYKGCGHLRNQYTLWGYVTHGMEHVERIRRGNKSYGGKVALPDTIVKMQIAADAS